MSYADKDIRDFLCNQIHELRHDECDWTNKEIRRIMYETFGDYRRYVPGVSDKFRDEALRQLKVFLALDLDPVGK